MFTPLPPTSPEESKKPENTPLENTETIPADWKPEKSSSNPFKAPTEIPSAFPTLAMPPEPHFPQNQPEPEFSSPSVAKSTPPGEDPAKPLYPPLPPKQKRGSLLELLFSSATRSGRMMRAVLRWLAAITGLFGLGLLTGYLLLYQPTQTELEAAQLQLKQANQSLLLKDQSIQTAKTDSSQVQTTLKQAQDDLKKAASENEILMVLVSVSNARVALVIKDGPTAKTAIEQAQAGLAKSQPYLESVDKTKFDVLKTRLDLAAKELISDPQAAQTDLDKLAADLTELRLKLFKK